VAWDIVYGISLAGACLVGWVFGWTGAKIRYMQRGGGGDGGR
jgi:hypothetical protein